MKKCSSCKVIKPDDSFYVVSGRLYAYCKPCNSQKTKVRYATNRENVLAYLASPKVQERTRKWKEVSPRHTLSIRRNAALKRRPTKIAVTIDELMDKFNAQQGKCAVSGLTMTWRKGDTTPYSISIDRIDSKKGYTNDNVRLVCVAINAFKGRWSDDHVFAMALAIIDMKSMLRLAS